MKNNSLKNGKKIRTVSLNSNLLLFCNQKVKDCILITGWKRVYHRIRNHSHHLENNVTIRIFCQFSKLGLTHILSLTSNKYYIQKMKVTRQNQLLAKLMEISQFQARNKPYKILNHYLRIKESLPSHQKISTFAYPNLYLRIAKSLPSHCQISTFALPNLYLRIPPYFIWLISRLKLRYCH